MTRAIATLAAAAAVFVASGAEAAPQILGIVASNGPLPLICDGGHCRADLSTFCLQQPRANPDRRQAYALAADSTVAVVGTNAAGEIVRLPISAAARFVSDRGFTSVEVSVPAERVAELEFTSVGIVVERGATLLPVETADDPNPQSSEEKSIALGAYRQQGEKFFDDSGESADAIRLTNVMINQLPKHQRHKTDTDGHLLTAALETEAAMLAVPAALDLAQSTHDNCIAKVDITHHIDNMRSCLQGSHDRLVVNTNIDFWNSLGNY